MKKWLWISYAATFLCGCIKENKTEGETKNDSPLIAQVHAVEEVAGDDWVWVANQASGMIEIYDPNVEDWNNSTALKWSWKPIAEKDYTEYALEHWDVPNDFKVRTISAWGGNYLVACASDGLCTIAAYPSGVKRWAYNVGSTVHPHSVELLPDGNIAVACTDQNLVKVFMSSSSVTDNIVYASFPLVKAHSVMWDPVTSTIRAIGNDHIVSLQLIGPITAPTLKEVRDARGFLETGGASLYGHDLSPDLNDNNILWCSTNGGAYSFNKTTRQFKLAPGGDTGVGKTFIKGISRQPSGIFVVTRPDSKKTSQPADPVTDPPWCTRYVDFYSSTGSFMYYRTKANAKFYKGKIFRTPY
jgi:hypothetical protein